MKFCVFSTLCLLSIILSSCSPVKLSEIRNEKYFRGEMRIDKDIIHLANHWDHNAIKHEVDPWDKKTSYMTVQKKKGVVTIESRYDDDYYGVIDMSRDGNSTNLIYYVVNNSINQKWMDEWVDIIKNAPEE